MSISGFAQYRKRIFSAAVFSLAATMVWPGYSTHAAINPFFTMQQTSSGDISAFTKWTSVLPRYEAQVAEAVEGCYGEGCLNRQWDELIASLRTRPVREQIREINAFFNAIPYVPDKENYDVSDYWQTPYELMEHGGDCEDYAIAKYISLRRLGIPEHDLRILVVHDNSRGGIIHAVLEVTLANGSQILDNQADTVVSATTVDNYEPVFAINGKQWWAFK